MKILKTIQQVLILTIIPITIIAQSTQFDLNAYRQFLESNKNTTSSQLLDMHQAGNFKADLNLFTDDFQYFDTISAKYELSNFEKSLANKNGFMVSERLSYNNFGSAFLDIFHRDLPVFVSTDAILIDKLSTLLKQLHSNLGTIDSKYSSYPEMNTMLKDVDVYLVIASRLLGDYYPPYFSENKARFCQYLF